MITRWEDGVYGEADRGKFDAYLLRGDTAIAYTDYDRVQIVKETYTDSDREAVEEFADQYDLPIEWDD